MEKIHENIKTKSHQLEEIVAKGLGSGGLTSEQKESFKKLENEIISLKEDLSIFEKASKIKQDLSTSTQTIAPAKQSIQTQVKVESKFSQKELEQRGFAKHLINSISTNQRSRQTLTSDEKGAYDLSIRATTMSNSTDGLGIVAPASLQEEIIKTLEDTSTLRTYATTRLDATDKDYPVNNTKFVLKNIGEGTLYPELQNVKFEDIKLKAYKSGGIAYMSEESLVDPRINILEEIVKPSLVEAKREIEENLFINGSIGNYPADYFTDSAYNGQAREGTEGRGILKDLNTTDAYSSSGALNKNGRKVTTASSSIITQQEISKVYFALPQVYRNAINTKFMCNSTVYSQLADLKDTLGRPLLQESLTGSPFKTYLGKEVIINDFLADVGVTGNIPLLFGDLSRFYIVDRLLMDLRAISKKEDMGLAGIRATQRQDCRLIDSNSFASLVMG